MRGEGLSDAELQEAGYFADDPAAKPLPGRYDPRPIDQDYVTDCGLMGEDREGVWSALQLDLLLDLEPSLWGVVDEFASTAVTKLTNFDWSTRSNKEFQAFETMLVATHRVRRNDPTSALAEVEE